MLLVKNMQHERIYLNDQIFWKQIVKHQNPTTFSFVYVEFPLIKPSWYAGFILLGILHYTLILSLWILWEALWDIPL